MSSFETVSLLSSLWPKELQLSKAGWTVITLLLLFFNEYLLIFFPWTRLCLSTRTEQSQVTWTCYCVGIFLGLKHSFLEEGKGLGGLWNFQETHRGHEASYPRFYTLAGAEMSLWWHCLHVVLGSSRMLFSCLVIRARVTLVTVPCCCE